MRERARERERERERVNLSYTVYFPSERVREDERERERMNKRDMLIMLEEERDTERFWPFGEKREGETDR